MSASSPSIGDKVIAAIAGQVEADRIVDHVERDIAGQDALHVAAMRVLEAHGTEGLAAFHGRLLKVLSRLHGGRSVPRQQATP